MHSRSRSIRRPWVGLSRRPYAWRMMQSARSVALAIRVFEFCLLAGILLAFVLGMMRIR